MSVFRLHFKKLIPNMFSKELKDDPVVKDSLRKCAMSIGEVYLCQHNYNSWQYFVESVCKPALVQAFYKYCKNHRGELFVSSRTPENMGWW